MSYDPSQPTISPTANRVLDYVRRHSQQTYGPTITYIAHRLDIGATSCSIAVSALRRAGYVTTYRITPGGKRSSSGGGQHRHVIPA